MPPSFGRLFVFFTFCDIIGSMWKVAQKPVLLNPPLAGEDFSALPKKMQEIIRWFSDDEQWYFNNKHYSFFYFLNPDAQYRFLNLEYERRKSYYDLEKFNEFHSGVTWFDETMIRELLHPQIASKIRSLIDRGEKLHIFWDLDFPFLTLSLEQQWIYLSVSHKSRRDIYNRFKWDNSVYYTKEDDDKFFGSFFEQIDFSDFYGAGSDAQVVERGASENGIAAVWEAVRDVAAATKEVVVEKLSRSEVVGSKLHRLHYKVRLIKEISASDNTDNYQKLLDLIFEVLEELVNSDVELPYQNKKVIFDEWFEYFFYYIYRVEGNFVNFFSRKPELLVLFFNALDLFTSQERFQRRAKLKNDFGCDITQIITPLILGAGKIVKECQSSKSEEQKREVLKDWYASLNKNGDRMRLFFWLMLSQKDTTPPTPTPQSETHQAS